MLLSLLGEQNPERIDRERGTNREVEEQENGHDDREDAPPTPILQKPDTRSGDGAHPLLAGVPLVPEGALIEGDYFPLLI